MTRTVKKTVKPATKRGLLQTGKKAGKAFVRLFVNKHFELARVPKEEWSTKEGDVMVNTFLISMFGAGISAYCEHDKEEIEAMHVVIRQFCAAHGNDAIKVYEDRNNAPQSIKDLFAAFTFNPSTLYIQKVCIEARKHENNPNWASRYVYKAACAKTMAANAAFPRYREAFPGAPGSWDKFLA